MTVSGNVQQETLQALRSSSSQTEAPVIEHDRVFEKPEPLIAFKGAVVFFGEKLWVDVRVERR